MNPNSNYKIVDWEGKNKLIKSYKYCYWDKKSETPKDFKQNWFLYNEKLDLWQQQSISFKKMMSLYINKGWKIVASGGGGSYEAQPYVAHLAKY